MCENRFSDYRYLAKVERALERAVDGNERRNRMESLLRSQSFRSHAARASASSTIAQVLNVRGLGRK